MENTTKNAQELCKELVQLVNQRMDERRVTILEVAMSGFMFAVTVYLSVAKKERLSLEHFLEGAGMAYEQGTAAKKLQESLTAPNPGGVN